MSKASDAAHRARKGIIGLLECCRCMFPVEQAPTSTGHDPQCPAHAMAMSAASTGATQWRVESR